MKSLALLLPIGSLFAALLSANAVAADDYDALFKAKKYAQAEQMANARLAADPANAPALKAKVDVILSQYADTRLDEAVKLSEQCVAAHPQGSICHEALGNTLGTKAMMGGLMSALGYAGKIRDAFIRAVELDPANISARHSLLQYYLMAPGIVGGSKSKAQVLIADTMKINPDAARLLQAGYDLADDKTSKAEAEALPAPAAPTNAVLDLQLDTLGDVAIAYMQDKKYGDAERVFRQMMMRFPDSGMGPYGIARALQERGRHADAAPFFDKAVAIEPKSFFYYRAGQNWEALNDKAKAATAYEKALTQRPGLSKKQKTDAEERLKQLKA